MEHRELPVTDFVISSNNADILNEMLMAVMPIKPFTHFGIVKGDSHSMRVFVQEECASLRMVPLARPLSAYKLADELMRLTRTGEARYGNAPHPSMFRGWEIRKGHLGRIPIIVAYAKWV